MRLRQQERFNTTGFSWSLYCYSPTSGLWLEARANGGRKLSTFTQVLCHTIRRYLYFSWVFPFSVTFTLNKIWYFGIWHSSDKTNAGGNMVKIITADHIHIFWGFSFKFFHIDMSSLKRQTWYDLLSWSLSAGVWMRFYSSLILDLTVASLLSASCVK